MRKAGGEPRAEEKQLVARLWWCRLEGGQGQGEGEGGGKEVGGGGGDSKEFRQGEGRREARKENKQGDAEESRSEKGRQEGKGVRGI